MKILIRMLMLSVTLTLNLPAYAEHPVTKTVTVTAQGEGLAATKWLAYLKAQHQLSLYLPAVTSLEMTKINRDISMRIHKIMASIVDTKLTETQHKEVLALPKPGETGDNKLYEVTSTYAFTYLPAEQVARSKQLLENQSLRLELERVWAKIPVDQAFYANAFNSKQVLKLIREHSNQSAFLAAQKALENDLDRVLLGMELTPDGFMEAAAKGNKLFQALRTHNAEQQRIEDLKTAHNEIVTRFIDLLPLAFANTIKVEEIKHDYELPAHTFGWDFFFSQRWIKEKLEPHHGPAVPVSTQPWEKITLHFKDNQYWKRTVVETDPRKMHLYDLYKTLPKKYQDFIDQDGLAAGDGMDDNDRFADRFFFARNNRQTVYAMPVVESDTETPPNRGGTDEAWERYTYKPGKVIPVPLESVSQFSDTSGVPDVIAAAFWRKTQVMLTVAFPEDNSYIDIPLTSDKYLLLPEDMTLYLNPLKNSEARIKKRAASIKSFVWLKTDTQQRSPARAQGLYELHGNLHYANLAKNPSDNMTYAQMKFLMEYEGYVEFMPYYPAIEHSTLELSACNRDYLEWDQFKIRRFGRYTNCKNHLILYYGKEHAANSQGVTRMVDLPFNNPMKTMKTCYTRTAYESRNPTKVRCEDYFANPNRLFMGNTPFSDRLNYGAFSMALDRDQNYKLLGEQRVKKLQQMRSINMYPVKMTMSGQEHPW